MKPTVMTVLGTRPEVVKLAPVVRALEARGGFRSLVCATAQHRDMLDLALNTFGVTPDVDLDLMRPDQQLPELTARVIEFVSRVLREARPDMVVVQGDTTTAMASALAAFYARVPVAHVEAGLRSGDMDNPFPEEMNRKVISSLASLHFAPTPAARLALLHEGVREESVAVTGNTVIDALQHVLQDLPAGTDAGRTILVTAHRRESFGAPLEGICRALRRLAEGHPELTVVYPVHPNPQVRHTVGAMLANLPNVRLTEPLAYEEFARAMRDAYLILTDSGGVQEEAPSLGKPVLVLRGTTERPEAIQAGAARLVGTDSERIVAECERLLNDEELYRHMASVRNPFGDGRAGERIVSAIERWFIRRGRLAPAEQRTA